MQSKELQTENEFLKAQILGLAHNLKIADQKIEQYKMQLENLHKQNMDLSAEIKHLNMLAVTSNYNRNDSRLY